MKALFIVLSLLLLLGIQTGCAEPEKETVIVGSKDFPEQFILGNILGLLIEAHTDLEVIHRENMASHVIFSAIETGAVDVYIDYTGTIYGSYFGLSESNDAVEIHEISASLLAERYDLRLFGKLGFNNTFGLAVRQDIALQFGLRTFSDLARVSSDFIFCGSMEIINRNDGIPNLKRVYDMSFKEEIVLHDRQRYLALQNGDAQVAEVFSTDGLLYEYDLVVLEDDKNFFPPYHAAIVARNDLLEKHPELINIFNLLEGKLTDDIMRSLNHRVDVGNESPRAVAESFLREHGLI